MSIRRGKVVEALTTLGINPSMAEEVRILVDRILVREHYAVMIVDDEDPRDDEHVHEHVDPQHPADAVVKE